ncbi:MAG: TIGR03016 family PEP-CTERM system-associated outer membrane protein [Deltaproteobacteria bacterium]
MRLKDLFITICAVSALFPAISAQAGEFKAKPSIMLGMEHNDNVFLERYARNSDYISKARPTLNLGYKASSLKLGTGYSYDYRHYLNGSRDDTETQDANLAAEAVFIENMLYLKASDVYTRTTLDSTRDTTGENFDVNQSDRNTVIINPYLVLRLDPLSDLTLSYTRTGTWYKEAEGIDKREEAVSVEVSRELSETTRVNAGHRYSRESDRTGGYVRRDAYAGAVYGRGSELGLSLKGGYTWLDPEFGKSYSRLFWETSLFRDFTAVKATLSSVSSVVENPLSTPQWRMTHSAELSKRTDTASVKLSFYLHEYRSMEERALQTRVYGNRGSLTYDLTGDLKGAFDYTIEKSEHRRVHTHTVRGLLSPGLTYSISADDTLTFAYNYASYKSPEIGTDNYKNNRFTIELRVNF